MNARNIAIICNPYSGKGKPLRLLPQFEAFLREQKITFQSFTHDLPPDLTGFTDLVIMGGDGTINHTLNYFNHIPIPVGLISCGTGNDIGKLLLGNTSFNEQFRIAVSSEAKTTDAGICNGRIFLNGAGIGFDGWVVKRQLGKKFLDGKAAYYSTVIGLLLFYKETRVTIETNEKKWDTDLFMLSAANGKTYGGGFNVAPKAEVNDGLLEIITVSKISLLTRISCLPVIEKGKHLEKKRAYISYQQSPSVKISSDHLLRAHLDGEYLEAKHFEISILPGKYRIRY